MAETKLKTQAVDSGVALTSPTITTNISPTSSDGAALGSTSAQFSDLFLAEGGVINWDNGDATLTQAGNYVTLAGAELVAPNFVTTYGTTSCNNAAATTIATLTAPGVYIVSVYYAANEASNPYFGIAIISVDGTTRNKIHLSNFGTNITITMSNISVQVTQSSGVTLSMNWRILRLV